MKSDSGILYHEPPKPLWVPRHYATAPQPLAVRYKTEICDVDSHGRIVRVRPGQTGFNTITDWGMDSIATVNQGNLINYLHLSSTAGPSKRVLSGGITLTLVITDATNIAVTASSGFFLAGDVGLTLSITDLGGAGQTQELRITAYTDSQHVTCATRQGAWLPNFVPGTGPFASAGVHPTNTSTLAAQFQKFNTYDTSASNYSAELNDSGNSRSIHQRIFLSAAAGSVWTILELGWSDGNAGNNVFGRVNLASADTVGVGQKYRVTLQLFSGYTPINIASQSVNWGATIGTYDLAIRQENIPMDSGIRPNFTRPSASGFTTTNMTAAFTMAATKWEGDAGYPNARNDNSNYEAAVSTGAYTGGTHNLNRTAKWSDAVTLTGCTGLIVDVNNYQILPALTIRPNSGSITKPAGYWCALTFQLFWTRTFTN